ncbi:hypothetical protein Acr_06g0007780 [Actinidia rufa]|uniref:Secreted protein n=1 Tax=Actinidia rufa TaxID=165716 RepID=A0A7J0EQR7_9ERIC|nr:hypothetical protein Acr_06g0007780 [Actinidia rufa]
MITFCCVDGCLPWLLLPCPTAAVLPAPLLPAQLGCCPVQSGAAACLSNLELLLLAPQLPRMLRGSAWDVPWDDAWVAPGLYRTAAYMCV